MQDVSDETTNARYVYLHRKWKDGNAADRSSDIDGIFAVGVNSPCKYQTKYRRLDLLLNINRIPLRV